MVKVTSMRKPKLAGLKQHLFTTNHDTSVNNHQRGKNTFIPFCDVFTWEPGF